MLDRPVAAAGADGADHGPDADARLAPLVASIAERLGGVCRDWNAAEFDTLVRRIARQKLRWADCGYDDK